MMAFKLIIAVLKCILKIIYWWVIKIPFAFGVLSSVIYFAAIYLIFGTIEIWKIERILGTDFNVIFGLLIPFELPIFLSYVSMFGGHSTSNLPNVITYRNGRMNQSSDIVAADIYFQTAHLDMINSNKNVSGAYGQMSRGFDAKYGTHSPSYIYNDLMNKVK
jgi:hypothetical protein